jgi:predicted cupin superfamily sugar epimerase/mannose-6-phosphate isomerase-like protein (cupin superfamily)
MTLATRASGNSFSRGRVSRLIVLTALATTAVSAAQRAAACDAQALIQHYAMRMVPQEGVWFAVSYESQDKIDGSALPARYGNAAHDAGSAIVAIETRTAFSAMHRLRTDETWHFYGGDPIDLLLLEPRGKARHVRLGSDPLAGETPQYTVPAGVWQGSSPVAGHGEGCSFFGTQLAPAFSYDDFEIGYRDTLEKAYPLEATRIAELTRDSFAVAPAGARDPAKAIVAQATPTAAPQPAQPTVAPVAPPAAPEPPKAAATPLPSPAPGEPAEPAIAQIGTADRAEIIHGAPGVSFKEVVGRVAALKSTRISVASFTVEPGHATPLSATHRGEETFLVVAGDGSMRLGDKIVTVQPGSAVVVPPGMPRSVIAGLGDPLRFYALTAPAWQASDDTILHDEK